MEKLSIITHFIFDFEIVWTFHEHSCTVRDGGTKDLAEANCMSRKYPLTMDKIITVGFVPVSEKNQLGGQYTVIKINFVVIGVIMLFAEYVDYFMGIAQSEEY